MRNDGVEDIMFKRKGKDGIAELANQAKLRLLKMHYESNVGHIGGNLSCFDILFILFHEIISPMDIFTLSKGHAAGALYVILWSLGRISEEELQQFHQDGTKLAGHPVSGWLPEIAFGTGSLGHGLSLSVGAALGKKLKGEAGTVFCLMSDGEWNEGSSWEALIFATHHKLDNLKIVIDNNKLQGFGATKEVANIEPLREKFVTFGAEVVGIDGHNYDAIKQGFSAQGTAPQVIIAYTKKGKGVSFMEDKMEWHYLPLTKEQYEQAIAEVREI